MQGPLDETRREVRDIGGLSKQNLDEAWAVYQAQLQQASTLDHVLPHMERIRTSAGVDGKYHPFSEYVRAFQARARAADIDPSKMDSHQVLDFIATRVRPHAPDPFGTSMTLLALSFWDRLMVHKVRPSVARLVDETDLHSLPGEPPRFLRSPWLIEVHRPETGDRLFGDCIALAGYLWLGEWFLFGLLWPDSVRVTQWRPRWGEQDLVAGIVRPNYGDLEALLGDLGAHREWGREAARFAVVFGLLLEAAAAPLRIRDDAEDASDAPAPRGKGGKRPAPRWLTRHIYLDEAKVCGQRARPGEQDAAAGGRVAAEATVRGHLKRQRHGPGGQLVKWVYIASYEARRWVAPRPTRVVVGLRGER
ncbi:MAG: hypothetical protein HY369_02835 [Candidatus Aenigmarchaeota archaeon]|nr:hypothetical protein [Candidatus Aenigmarchaeota archaeon]